MAAESKGCSLIIFVSLQEHFFASGAGGAAARLAGGRGGKRKGRLVCIWRHNMSMEWQMRNTLSVACVCWHCPPGPSAGTAGNSPLLPENPLQRAGGGDNVLQRQHALRSCKGKAPCPSSVPAVRKGKLSRAARGFIFEEILGAGVPYRLPYTQTCTRTFGTQQCSFSNWPKCQLPPTLVASPRESPLSSPAAYSTSCCPLPVYSSAS